MGAAAGGERRAVAAHEIDRLGLDAELIGHHLPEARFVALPARLRSHDQIDAASADTSTATRSCGIPTGVST